MVDRTLYGPRAYRTPCIDTLWTICFNLPITQLMWKQSKCQSRLWAIIANFQTISECLRGSYQLKMSTGNETINLASLHEDIIRRIIRFDERYDIQLVLKSRLVNFFPNRCLEKDKKYIDTCRFPNHGTQSLSITSQIGATFQRLSL